VRGVRWAKCAAPALLLAAASCTGNNMTEDKIELKFAPLSVEGAGAAKSIRMVKSGDRTALAMLADSAGGGTAVYVFPLGPSGAGRAGFSFALESPFGIPSWDAAVAQGGIAAVWTKPGSAICPLGYRLPNGGVTVLTGRYPSGVFQGPRFVRGEPAGTAAVTAVAYEGNSRVVALFSGSLESGQAAYAALPSAGKGLLLDGLALRNGPGYVLIVKLVAPGERGPERKDRRGESFAPGILKSLLVDAKLEPVGEVESPIGDAPVFEFDADAFGGRVFLVATTAAGSVAASALASERKVHWTGTAAIPSAGELTAPTVLAMTKDSAAVAAIEQSAAPPQTRIVLGQMTVKD
jgi:hypothetical protein